MPREPMGAPRHACGWLAAGELEAKNVTVLMPPHIAARHASYMRRNVESSDADTSFKRNVMGLHRDKVVFPLRLSVNRSSGAQRDRPHLFMCGLHV